jgi:hypothetical protein
LSIVEDGGELVTLSLLLAFVVQITRNARTRAASVKAPCDGNVTLTPLL